MKKTITTTYTDQEFRALIREEVNAAISGNAASGASDKHEGFLGVTEAAEFLKLKPNTIYNHITKNTIPYHKKEGSRRVLFLKSELIDWLKEDK